MPEKMNRSLPTGGRKIRMKKKASNKYSKKWGIISNLKSGKSVLGREDKNKIIP
jgi:hypothetical protein